MKTRVTLTLDPDVVQHAKNVARVRQTNLSALIEDLLKNTAEQGMSKRPHFSKKWGGKFSVRPSDGSDELLDALKERFGLSEK